MERLTSLQFSEWLAWATLRGMPLDRADFRSAQICAVLANIHRKEDAEPFVAGDFIPQMAAAVEEEEEDLSEVDTEALSRQIQRVLGKKDV